MEVEMKENPNDNDSEPKGRTRDKKISQRNKNLDEETRHHIKLTKLAMLEDDDIFGPKEE